MKPNSILLFLIFIIALSCSKTVDYTQEFMNATSGRYLYTADESINVYFKENTLLFKWRGKEDIEPILLNENQFFVKELNKKMQFIKNPETNNYYLTEILEIKDSIPSKYFKLADSVDVPSVYLKNKQYKKALEGYLAIQKEDSNSVFLNERAFNRYGYTFLREENYQDAIEVFKLNIALHPTSDNVYDSLAEAYAKSGDSLKAYEYYKKALQFNTGNRGAKRFVEAYKKK